MQFSSVFDFMNRQDVGINPFNSASPFSIAFVVKRYHCDDVCSFLLFKSLLTSQVAPLYSSQQIQTVPVGSRSINPLAAMSFLYSIPGARLLQTKLNHLSSYVPPPPMENTDPRRILLVHSHPNPDSFSAAIADTFQESAVEAGHEVKRISLYGHDNPNKCYRPNMSRKEREDYFKLMQDGSKAGSLLAPEVKGHIELLQWCDTLVLVYPTWWMNTPASLKGFFDRTLVGGITWEFPSATNGAASLGLAPKLGNIEHIVGVSTYGASQAIVTLAGDNGRRMISNAIRHSVCPNASVSWLGLYGVDTISREGRTHFLKSVAKLPKDL